MSRPPSVMASGAKPSSLLDRRGAPRLAMTGLAEGLG